MESVYTEYKLGPQTFQQWAHWVELVIAGRKKERIQRADEVQMLTQRDRNRQMKKERKTEEKMRERRKMKERTKSKSDGKTQMVQK